MRKLTLVAVAITSALTTSLTFAPQAYANNEIKTASAYKPSTSKAVALTIPAGKLGDALVALSKLTGTSISVDAALIQGLNSQAISGNYNAEQAIQQLITDLPLQLKVTTANSLTLVAKDKAAVIGTLATAQVTDEQENAKGPVNGYVAKRSFTGTKTDTAIIETPQSISVFTADRIEALGASRLTEVLSYAPGVNVSPFGDMSQYDWLTLRGFDAYSPGFYLDGMQLRNNGNWGLWLTENYGLERIELLRGPSSVLYGQNGPGGLVNMVSKRPLTEDKKEIQLQLGSDSHKQIAGDFSGALDSDGKWLYRLTALVRDAELSSEELKNNRVFIAPSLTWQPSPQTSLTILSQYLDADAGAVWPGYPLEGTLLPNPNGAIPQSTLIGEPDFNRYQQEQWMLGYDFTHQINDTWSIAQNARYGDYDLDYRVVWGKWLTTNEQEPNSAENFRLYNRTPFKSVETTNSFTIDSRAIADFSLGDWQHSILFGIDYQNTENDTIAHWGGELAPLDLFEPVYDAKVSLNPPFINAVTELSQTGFYLQDQIKFAKRWILTLGARYDNAEVIATDRASNASAKQSDDEWSTRAGLVYLADNGLAPYISYSESFSPNTSTDPLTGKPFSPESGRQYEAGLRYQPKGQQASYSVAAFDLTRQDYIVWQWQPNPGPRQTGETTVRGMEFEALVEPTDNMNLTASYSWTPKADVTKSINTATIGLQDKAVSEHQANAWADYQFNNGLNLGLGIRFVGSNMGNQEKAPIEVSSYTLFDASIGYQLDNWQLRINARNLGDKSYLSGCGDRGCYYGERRKIVASFTYNW